MSAFIPCRADGSHFPDRVRFNWGFHDGQHEASMRWRVRDVSQHFDRVYAAGYTAGVDAMRVAGERAESSEPAWQAYRGELEARRAARRVLPDNRKVRV